MSDLIVVVGGTVIGMMIVSLFVALCGKDK